MKLTDLKSGYNVKLKNGKEYMFVENFYTIEGLETDALVSFKEDGILFVRAQYDIDLRNCISDDLDIEKVYHFDKLIWERKNEIDWSKVSTDTVIRVKDNAEGRWVNRYFAYELDGRVYAFKNGASSITADWNDNVKGWNYAELY